MARWLFRPWLLAVAACAWWLGVILFDLIKYSPSPYGDIVWLEWRQMALVTRIAPWMSLPFAALAAWGLALRVKAGRVPSSWMTWVCGTAALAWTGFVFWRAHGQAFTCAVWAPREEFFRNEHCWLPHILGSILPWLAIPVVAWIVLAALRLPFHPAPDASKPACSLPSRPNRC